MACHDPMAEGEEHERTRRRLHAVTRLLCGLCERIETNPNATVKAARLIDADPKLRAWWEEHQKADRKREKEEAAERRRAAGRKAALAKLSPAERKLLGV